MQKIFNKVNKETNNKIQDLAISVIDPMNLNKDENFNELVVLIMPKLKFFIWKFFNNNEDTEDVLHNALEKICKKIDTFNPMWRFTTWAFRISRNEALLYRHIKRSNDVDIDSVFFQVENTIVDGSKETGTKETEFENLFIAMWYEIHDLKNDTTINQQNVNIFYQKEINNVKIKDIAKRYDLSENTVKTKLRTMRSIIRNRIFRKYPYLTDKYRDIINF